MEQIIIKCDFPSEPFYKILNDIDYLKETSIYFKVNFRHKEIIFPKLNKMLMYVRTEDLGNLNINLNMIDSDNFSIKEIIESSDK